MNDVPIDSDLDPTEGLLLLADPLDAGSLKPSAAETAALFDRIVLEADPRVASAADRRIRRRLLLTAAAIVVALVGVTLVFPDGDLKPAAAISAALGQAQAEGSGTFTVNRVVTSGERTLTQTGRIAFDGEDYSIAYVNEGGILDPSEGVTPPAIEFREVGGVAFVGSDRGWAESMDSPATHPMRTLAARVDHAAAVAVDLDLCPDQVPARTSFCLSSDDPALVAALQPGLLETFEMVSATIRVEVDPSTGRLVRIVVEASDLIVADVADSAVPPPIIPPIDEYRSETVFDGLGSTVQIEAPIVGLALPTGDVPWQCDGLQHSEDMVGCLEFYEEHELADHYRTLDPPNVGLED